LSTSYAVDSLNGTPGADLASRLTQDGAAWTRSTSKGGNSNFVFTPSGIGVSLNPTSSEATYTLSGPSGSDYQLQATFRFGGTTAGSFGLVGDFDSAGQNGYLATYEFGGDPIKTGSWLLLKKSYGTTSKIGQLQQPLNPDTDYTITFTRVGSVVTMSINGTKIGAMTDPVPLANGPGGIYLDATTATATNFAATYNVSSTVGLTPMGPSLSQTASPPTFDDLFARSNGAVGNGWNDLNGKWSITSNTLQSVSKGFSTDLLLRPSSESMTDCQVSLISTAEAQSDTGPATAFVWLRASTGKNGYVAWVGSSQNVTTLNIGIMSGGSLSGITSSTAVAVTVGTQYLVSFSSIGTALTVSVAAASAPDTILATKSLTDSTYTSGVSGLSPNGTNVNIVERFTVSGGATLPAPAPTPTPTPVPVGPLRPSGASFAQFRGGGLAGQLELLIAANPTLDPAIIVGLRAGRINMLDLTYSGLASLVASFLQGDPIATSDVTSRLDAYATVFSGYTQAVNEINSLIKANPGTIVNLLTSPSAPRQVQQRWFN